MSLWDKVKGNPLEKMKIRDLRAEEIRLKTRVDHITKDIDKVEKEKRKLFQQGIAAGAIKKRILSQNISGLDMEAKLKLKNFTTARQQLMFIKNMLIVKNYEKELKNIGVWKKITSIPPEKLEGFLIGVRLEGKEFDDVLSQLNQPFEMDVAEIEGEEMKESERKLFEAWDKVEAGSMDVSDAESTFSVDKELEAAEEE